MDYDSYLLPFSLRFLSLVYDVVSAENKVWSKPLFLNFSGIYNCKLLTFKYLSNTPFLFHVSKPTISR